MPLCKHIPVYLFILLLMAVEDVSDFLAMAVSVALNIVIYASLYIHVRTSLYALGKKLLSHRVNVNQFNIIITIIIIIPCLLKIVVCALVRVNTFIPAFK